MLEAASLALASVVSTGASDAEAASVGVGSGASVLASGTSVGVASALMVKFAPGTDPAPWPKKFDTQEQLVTSGNCP